MDIGFTEEQELLRASARRFLEKECPTAFVRQRMAEPAAMTDAFWQQLADQGWFGILYPEEAGGSGLGLVDMTVLMEEMGRAVMPGPFFSTVLLGGSAILDRVPCCRLVHPLRNLSRQFLLGPRHHYSQAHFLHQHGHVAEAEPAAARSSE